MNMKLSMIQQANTVELVQDGEFDSFALTNGKLKKGNKLLVYLSDEEYISHIEGNGEIKCILCTQEIYKIIKDKNKSDISKMGIAVTKNPRTDFFLFHNFLNRHTDFYNNKIIKSIDQTAQIHRSCVLPDKNVIIGKNVVIHPNVVLHENVYIEDNVTIGEGSVLGSPAFYYYDINGKKEIVDSTGSIVIKQNVDIHSHVVICKGTLGGMTEIGAGSKLDSNVFIAHDVTIGDNCLITAGSIFAGGVIIGENCFVGIGSKIAPLINIGKNAKISAGSVVVQNIKENTHVSGNFAIDHIKYAKFVWKIANEKY